MAEKCEMIIGYLVPHRCENPSLGKCAKCGRGFCDEHTNQKKEGRVCLACQQGLDMPVALPIAAALFTTADLDTFDRSRRFNDTDDDTGEMFSDLKLNMNILLLHGQGRTTNAMRLLGVRLQQLGHHVQYFRYYTRTEKFDEIVKRLVDTIKLIDKPYTLIGHSMGGLLARASLPMLADHLPFHLVLLASPSRPPRLAPYVKHNRLYQYLTSDCGQQVAKTEFYQSLPKPSIPTTIIAGSGGPRMRWLPYGYEANDGAMSVQDTYLGSEYKVIEVPSIHTFIMNSKKTLHHINLILQ